jgi:hypothetical protein
VLNGINNMYDKNIAIMIRSRVDLEIPVTAVESKITSCNNV